MNDTDPRPTGEEATLLDHPSHYRGVVERPGEDLDAGRLTTRSVPPSVTEASASWRREVAAADAWSAGVPRRADRGVNVPGLSDPRTR